MSIKRMSTVWEQSQAKGSALLLLLALADNADDLGFCWPGIRYLAKKIRLTQQSVINITKGLEATGELYVHHSRRHGNRYLVITGFNESEIEQGLRRFDYSEEEVGSITQTLIIKLGFSSEPKDNFSSELKHVLEEPSCTHQVSVKEDYADACSDSDSSPKQNPPQETLVAFSEKEPPPSEDLAVTVSLEAQQPDDEFDGLFPRTEPAVAPLEAPFTAQDLQTEEGRQKAQAHLIAQRQGTLVEKRRFSVETLCDALWRYKPGIGIERTAVIEFIQLLVDNHVPLDYQKKAEVKFWISETESLLRKAQGDSAVLAAALQKVQDDGMTIKGPKSIGYAISTIMQDQGRTKPGYGRSSGSKGGMITKLHRIVVPPPED